MQKLWPDSFVEEANLTHHIWTLRKALGERESGLQYIQTVPRLGYRFVADVQQTVPPEKPIVVPSPARSTDVEKVSPLTSFRSGVIVLLGLIFITLLGFGYFAYNRIWLQTVPKTRKVVLLVLPFENSSGNPEEQYFSDGMTEEMITGLANLQPERLRVIPRASALRVKSGGKDIDQVAGKLGVDYVLESSVYRSNNRIRINARLIKVRDESHV